MTERCTRITIETERILVIARQHATRGWCKRCGADVEFLPSKQAGDLLEDPEQMQGKHRNQLHLGQTKNGLLICVKSFLRFLQFARQRTGP